MKQRNKNFLQRLLALTLTIILVSTNTSIMNVLAVDGNDMTSKPAVDPKDQGAAIAAGASSNSIHSGNGANPTSLGDMSGYVNSRAYLITLIKVENTAGGNDKFKAALLADKTLTQIAYSTADQYLSNYKKKSQAYTPAWLLKHILYKKHVLTPF